MIEDLADHWNQRQKIIAWVAICIEDLIHLLIQFLMEAIGHRWRQVHVSIPDVLPKSFLVELTSCLMNCRHYKILV